MKLSTPYGAFIFFVNYLFFWFFYDIMRCTERMATAKGFYYAK